MTQEIQLLTHHTAERFTHRLWWRTMKNGKLQNVTSTPRPT